jgi:hypothetical protein
MAVGGPNAAGLDAGEIQQRVDQAQQTEAVAVHHRQLPGIA